jgi:hypothetical protein
MRPFMKILYRLLTLIAVIVSVASCGTVPVNSPRFSEERPVPTDLATLYLYSLPSHVGGASCPRFQITKNVSVQLPNGSFARVDVLPGTQTIEAQTSWCFAVPVESKLTVQKGERVFVRLTRREGYWPGAVRTPGPDNWWLGFEIVPTNVALEEIRELGRTN